MKSFLASITIATMVLQSAAWMYSFSDDPGCLFTHDGEDGTGNKDCTNIEPGDDSDHVQIDGLAGCIITFFEQTDCLADGGDGNMDVYDEGKPRTLTFVSLFLTSLRWLRGI